MNRTALQQLLRVDIVCYEYSNMSRAIPYYHLGNPLPLPIPAALRARCAAPGGRPLPRPPGPPPGACGCLDSSLAVFPHSHTHQSVMPYLLVNSAAALARRRNVRRK